MDEAATRSSVQAARDSLLHAVKRRDADFVLQSLGPGFRLQGVTDFAVEGFERGLRATDRDLGVGVTHEYWRGLESALSLGGAFTTARGGELGREEFCAPYVYSAYPKNLPATLHGEVEPWVVTGEEVPMFAQPSTESPVIGTLSYDLVRVDDAATTDRHGKAWMRVTPANGKEGYVGAEFLRGPEDYYVCLAPVDDRWLISAVGRGRSPR